MTNRRERRLFRFLIFWCGVVLASLPAVMPDARYPVLGPSAGGLLIAAAGWRLWTLRRRVRRHNHET